MTAAPQLLLRSGRRLVAVPVAEAERVLEPGTVYPVPTLDPAVRGVIAVGDGFVPLVDVAVLLGQPPRAAFELALLVRTGAGRLALAADEAVEVRAIPAQELGEFRGAAWAARVVEVDGARVPVLDPTRLGAALRGTAA